MNKKTKLRTYKIKNKFKKRGISERRRSETEEEIDTIERRNERIEN